MEGIVSRIFGNSLIATENLIDAGDTSVQNSWIARGALAGCIMEHRGVRYELRRGLGNDEWVWTVYTPALRADPGSS